MKEYKGYYIEFNIYNKGEYKVQYCGDDLWFGSEQEAMDFIDEVSREEGYDVQDHNA